MSGIQIDASEIPRVVPCYHSLTQTVMATNLAEIRQIGAQDTVPLRHSILWPTHPVTHVLLPEDDIGFHYGAFIPTLSVDPVAVISVFYDPVPGPADHVSTAPATNTSAEVITPRAARFRKFACASEHQGKGVGTCLLEHVFAVAAREMGCAVIWCDARRSASGWYERRGMRMFGETFFKGDIEYVRMMRDL
ncbi:hypothetical protein BC628DRAFT_1385408 [Trametes gibbosa]|nr:hypothetical protein BC628DRAFT_1385408 [Trametes gibbosa]